MKQLTTKRQQPHVLYPKFKMLTVTLLLDCGEDEDFSSLFIHSVTQDADDLIDLT
jgi:hypothetical protein